jgi:hypothetical protein
MGSHWRSGEKVEGAVVSPTVRVGLATPASLPVQASSHRQRDYRSTSASTQEIKV